MPETGIGLFPDVGGGYYLSRLPQRLGRFLALTGTQLDGAECLWLGLGTHHVPGSALVQLKAALAHAPEAPQDVLRAHASPAPPARLAEHAERIARTFASDRLEDDLEALAQDGSDWSARVRRTLAEKSPQACKIALRQLALGEQLPSLADDLRMEYRIASRVLMRPDFSEGVRAVIIDKDNAPRWNPGTPQAVDEALLDAIFAPLSAAQEWQPL
jgi:enoyl-CoA hydratase